MPELTRPIFNQVTTELPTAPVVTPSSLEPQAVEPPTKVPPQAPPPKQRFWLMAVAAALSLLALLIWALIGRRGQTATSTASESTLRTATIERRDFVRTLRLTGTTEAVSSRAILAPQLAGSQLEQLVITKLALAGVKVKQGALLVEFDRQGQIKNFLDKQAEYRDFVDQIAKKQADEQAARAKDETELKQAEDDLKKAELEIQKNEVISRIDAEKNQETLEEAKANLQALRATFDLKRAAAQADIRILEIQRDRARETMLHARRNQDLMSIKSPMDGVVVLNPIWKEGKRDVVQEGDEVRPGVPFMQVVDTSAMQVRVKVNQADLLEFRVGQPAEMRLDAYPDMVFTGKLEQLAPIGNEGQFSDKVRNFTALFLVHGSDPKLMPDLTAAIDVQIERQPNVLIAPRDSLIGDKNHTYVRLKSGSGFEKREVKIGSMNDMEAVVESGVRAGDVVERSAGAG